ncbi:unnamed protein product [Phytophthora lilii]|uniref:Unnamed protein product n=1 Tax=Phytophthora lilii TaxID=2077276 RepID=A0A9W7D8R7_9STRA|nr:unnamed protein product [Phytophthora lilii]
MNIKFIHELVVYQVKPNTSTTSPWISSKPDSYDCADTFLSWNQMRGCSCTAYNHLSITGQQDYRNQNTRKPQITQVDLCEAETCDSCTRLPLPLPIPDDTKSSYFDTDKAVECLSSFQYPPLRLTAALRVKKVHILNGIQTIKLNKSTLAEMKVIRQVDRKFILVQANTSEGRLLLCIDQHAADERVRLEKFEADMFSYDGSLKRVEVSKYDPPLILRLNSRECEMLHRYENHIRKWGFDFELTPAQEPESMLNMRSDTNAQGLVHVLLYATPTVEKRSLSVEDFRDFLQLLSSNGGTTLCSSVRPPAITRLLHSRACRSAIMFGDFLSTAQCEELLNELKTCQLPFQCAHGRPSVVPLAQIQSRDHNDNQ